MAMKGGVRRRTGNRRWGFAALVFFGLIAGLAVMGTPADGYASAGTAYSARVACSCRFVADRSLEDCEKDQLAGMELVSLSADEDERSVTASLLFVKRDKAVYREGFGCVLQEWGES